MLFQDQETSSLLETKFELMLNMSFQKTKKEIDALRQQVELLSKELEAVKKSSTRPREEQMTLVQQPHFEVPQHQVSQPQAAQEGTQPRSRTGNYSTDDVSIEKMFYFGGGRK